jgi:hypothetical protein
MSERSFSLGQTVITANAKNELHPEDVIKALARHASCDWGDVDEDDRRENDLSLNQPLRLFSVYHDRIGTKFWIITEADRTATGVILPDEYWALPARLHVTDFGPVPMVSLDSC